MTTDKSLLERLNELEEHVEDVSAFLRLKIKDEQQKVVIVADERINAEPEVKPLKYRARSVDILGIALVTVLAEMADDPENILLERVLFHKADVRLMFLNPLSSYVNRRADEDGDDPELLRGILRKSVERAREVFDKLLNLVNNEPSNTAKHVLAYLHTLPRDSAGRNRAVIPENLHVNANDVIQALDELERLGLVRVEQSMYEQTMHGSRYLERAAGRGYAINDLLQTWGDEKLDPIKVGSFYIKVIDSNPYFSICRTDDVIHWGIYTAARRGTRCAQFRVSRGNELFAQLEEHFNAVWRPRSPEVKADSLVRCGCIGREMTMQFNDDLFQAAMAAHLTDAGQGV